MSVETKKIRAGIIGLGVGEAHIAGYEAHEACGVTALCDIDDSKAAMAKEKYADKIFTKNAADILTDPDIDVVSIASYDDKHFEQIILALENDKHIFVEKPVCLHEEEARVIRAKLNEKPHLKISSNLILRQCPRFMALKENIQNGELGELFNIEGDYNYGRIHKLTEGWRGKMDFYSVVLGGGVHLIDLFLWLTGDRVKEVSAYGNNIAVKGSPFQYNDMVTSILKFESGMVGKLAVSFGCKEPHFHHLNVYGTEGTFKNTPNEGLIYTSRDAEVKPALMTEGYPGVHKGDLLKDFIDAIIENREPLIQKQEVFDVLSICFAIERAVKEGPVEVDYI